MGFNVTIDEFGLPIEQIHAENSYGFRYVNPIKNIRTDFAKLRKPSLKVDMNDSLAYRDFVAELIGNILPVEFESRPPDSFTYAESNTASGHGELFYFNA